MQSLEIKWQVHAHDRNAASMVPHLGGRQAYSALWDALAEMPSLTHLRIALLMPRSAASVASPPSIEMRDLYLGPIERLKGLTSCEVAIPSSYLLVLGKEACQSLARCRRTTSDFRLTCVDEVPRLSPMRLDEDNFFDHLSHIFTYLNIGKTDD